MTSKATTFIRRQINAWALIRDQFKDNETPNGPGSQLGFTQHLIERLPELFKQYKIQTILDAPCGDWNWMQYVDLDFVSMYAGWDSETAFIEENRKRFGHTGFQNFKRVNLLTVTKWPSVDLIIMRDFMIHLPTSFSVTILNRIKASGSRYLLATNFPGEHNDYHCDLNGGHDDRPGYFCRPVNLEAEPFNLGGRVDEITEDADHELTLFDLRRDK